MALLLTPYQLRFCPARYLDERHLSGSVREVLAGLAQWREQSRLNAWLLEELSLSTDYRMPEALGGLALYPQAAFELTLGYLGGLLHGQAMRQLLRASDVQPVREAIGEAGHRYCLEQLDLIIGRWPAGWQQRLPHGSLQGYFQACGLQFWLFALGSVDEGYTRRLALRLAPHAQLPTLLADAENQPLARALCLKVARQVSPECFHLLK